MITADDQKQHLALLSMSLKFAIHLQNKIEFFPLAWEGKAEIPETFFDYSGRGLSTISRFHYWQVLLYNLYTMYVYMFWNIAKASALARTLALHSKNANYAHSTAQKMCRIKRNRNILYGTKRDTYIHSLSFASSTLYRNFYNTNVSVSQCMR